MHSRSRSAPSSSRTFSHTSSGIPAALSSTLLASLLALAPSLALAAAKTVIAPGYVIKSDNSLWRLSAPSIYNPGAGWTTAKVASNIVSLENSGTWSAEHAIDANGTLSNLNPGSYTATHETALPTGVDSLASGFSGQGYHFLALTTDGSVWSWGYNDHGQLGDGNSGMNANRTELLTRWGAQKIIDNIRQVAAAGDSSYAIDRSGNLYAWGSNYNGELGDGTRNDVRTPKMVGSGFQFIAGGGTHALALKDDGNLYGWGANDSYQLGVSTSEKCGSGGISCTTSPVLIGSGFKTVAACYTASYGLKTDGSLWFWGTVPTSSGRTAVQTPIQIQSNVVAMSCNTSGNVFIVTVGGSVQLGSNTTATGTTFTKIAAEGFYSASSSQSDCVFDWLESTYPTLLTPKKPASQSLGEYYFRYYPTAKAYVALNAQDNHLYYLGSASNQSLADLGSLSGWQGKASCQ